MGKGVIQHINKMMLSIYLQSFSGQKKDGSYRLILNLRNLNEYEDK